MNFATNRFSMSLSTSCLLRATVCAAMAFPLLSTFAQTPSSVEAAEYEPNSNRWLVSNGSSILVTADLGASWTTFGSGGATHGMEVLGSTLFAIQSNVIRAYDVVSGEELGSLVPNGAGFLNGMGSESTANGDVLVVSDFASGRLFLVDVSDPTNMTYTTLVSDTGTTPNGVAIRDGVATVVNWGSNADILQVDLATGEMTTLIDGTGLGNCDGVDWANGSLIVSSWSPQRITRFSPDLAMPGEWVAETLVQGNPLSNPADLSVNTAGDRFAVACSGNNTVYFGELESVSGLRPIVLPEAEAALLAEGVVLKAAHSGAWTVRGMDVSGRQLGNTSELPHPSGTATWTWDELGPWAADAALLDIRFAPDHAGSPLWQTTLKRAPIR